MKMIVLLIFFTLSSSAQSKVNYYYTDPDMPFELKVLYEGYNFIASENDTSTQELDKFLSILLNNFTKLSREEILFLGKSEMIKTVLKYSPEEMKTNEIPADFIRELRSSMSKEEYQAINPFAKWLLSSLIVDYDNLIKAKNSTISKKRLDLIIPFLNMIRLNGLAEFDIVTRQLMLEVAKRMVHFSSINLLYSSRLAITPSNKKLAVISSNRPQFSSKDRDIEDILAPIIEKHKKLGLPVPIDDWRPTEADFNLKSQAVSPTPSAQGQEAKAIDPKSLPKPIDDWNVEDLF